MGHVGLETDRLRAVNEFQQPHHLFPTVHAAPADFALGGKAFAKTFRDIGGFAKSPGDQLCVSFRLLEPVTRTTSGVNAHHAVGTNAQLSQFRGNPTAFADLFDELFPLVFAPHRRAAAGGRPDRRDHGTNHKTLRRDLVSEPFQFILADVDIDVRVEKKNVHPVELDTVHFGLRCQIEHRVQIDERFGAGAAFADEAGPHGVVKPGIVVVAVITHGRSFSLIVLPGSEFKSQCLSCHSFSPEIVANLASAFKQSMPKCSSRRPSHTMNRPLVLVVVLDLVPDWPTWF